MKKTCLKNSGWTTWQVPSNEGSSAVLQFCCVHMRPMPLALFKTWGSHLLGAPPRPTGAVPQDLHLCQPIVFHCFKTWRWSETTPDINPIYWCFEEEGCVWMLALENSNYWSPRLAAVFSLGNRTQMLACLLGKNGSGRLSLHLCLQTHLP